MPKKYLAKKGGKKKRGKKAAIGRQRKIRDVGGDARDLDLRKPNRGVGPLMQNTKWESKQ